LDNGKSTPTIVEGVGISGMRERVENFGGDIEFLNQLDGFKVKVRLPLPEGIHEQDKSSVS
jgi:signal transduction histidine kinase